MKETINGNKLYPSKKEDKLQGALASTAEIFQILHQTQKQKVPQSIDDHPLHPKINLNQNLASLLIAELIILISKATHRFKHMKMHNGSLQVSIRLQLILDSVYCYAFRGMMKITCHFKVSFNANNERTNIIHKVKVPAYVTVSNNT